jgi:hypothetical protein
MDVNVDVNVDVDSAEIPEWIITNILAGNSSRGLALGPIRNRLAAPAT